MSCRRSSGPITGMLVSVLLVSTQSGAAQYDLHQRPGMTTTDDPRRVPIPPAITSQEGVLVLRGGTLIDGTGAAPVANAMVVMQGNRILDIGAASKVAVPEKVDQTIDVSGLWIVPGLIDLHVHFTQQRGTDFGTYAESDAAAAIRGVAKLGLLLDGGITTVRDVGTRNDVALKIKEAVKRRIFPGPRVFWSGQIIASRGGHGDEMTSTGSGRPVATGGTQVLAGGPNVRVATGPWDWRLAVREMIRAGADWIKLAAPFTKEEVAAAVDEAHMLGIRVTADAFGHYVEWAAHAGIDCIEHPLAIPDDAIRVMAEKGTALVPTVTAFYIPLTFGYPVAGVPKGGFFHTFSRRFFMTHESNLNVVRAAREAGVKIGVGTDIAFENEKHYPGAYFTELNFLKEAGLTNDQLLASATRVGAEILGMADKLGTLEKGKLADVLVVSGNPLDDVQNLRNVKLLVADGEVVRNRLARETSSTAQSR